MELNTIYVFVSTQSTENSKKIGRRRSPFSENFYLLHHIHPVLTIVLFHIWKLKKIKLISKYISLVSYDNPL